MASQCAAAARIMFDYLCAPTIERWRADFIRIKSGLAADVEHLKRHKSIWRRRPEKGILRIVLLGNWVVLHLYALIVLSVYHAYSSNPHAATWWFWSTAFSGFMYTGLMYSDPGFIDKEMLVRLTENLKLGAPVVASDAGRGLLQDVAGDAPNMQPLDPAADPDDPEAARTTGAEGDGQGLLRPPLTAQQKQEQWEQRQRKETAATLAHAKAYWAQRPQDWSEYGTLVVPNAEQAAARGKEGTPAAAAAAGDSTDRSESSSASSAVPAAPAAVRHRPDGSGDGEARPGDVEIELSEAAAQQPPKSVEQSGGGGSEGGDGSASSGASGGGEEGGMSGGGASGSSSRSTREGVRPAGPGRAKVVPTGGGDNNASSDEEDATSLAHTLARNPRIVGYDEEGEAEAMAEAMRVAEWRKAQPLGIADFFSGYCDEEDMYLPIRAKYCKKHGRVVSKFDHYCYAVGTSIGELNHGRFYRLLCAQVCSIWMGEWLLAHSYLSFTTTLVWTVANTPLLLMNLLTWCVGIPLSILLCIHTFMMLTSSTTYEFIKLEKLEYLNGFYQFSFPFSEGLFQNIGHFCCPKGVQLWKRAPPEHEWEETFWRNRYYSCCG